MTVALRSKGEHLLDGSREILCFHCLKQPCRVKLYSDSAYLVNAFLQRWLVSWQKNNWLKSDKKPVENQDLWKILLELTKTHDVTFIKVKGHASNVENNRCDQLATGSIKARGSVV